MYRLRFLGGVSIEGPKGPVIGPAVQPRRLAFLALLAVSRGQAVSRDKLIALLYPESSPEGARHSLRETVYVLNHQLEGSPVEVVKEGLRIDPERFPSDVAAFEAAIETGNQERAVELYGGGFLDGLFLKGALEFEEWAREERDRLGRAYSQALEALADAAVRRGDSQQAVSLSRDWVAHDPYNGRATVRLMEALAKVGDRVEALRQADAHGERMREEFDAAPDRAVTELADRLREESIEGSVVRRRPAVAGGATRVLPRPLRHLWLPLAVVVLVGGLALWDMAREAEPGPEEAAASVDARAVAVLPFATRGEEVSVLREGMVDLLSTGLDGAGGLRTISPATLFARWDENVPGEGTADLPVMLEVAHRSGAKYALIGSAVAVGQELRMMAEVYDVETAERLGQGNAEGTFEGLLDLIDHLAVDILRVILQRGEDELPEIDLASLTTASPAALQAFLEGEVHFRHYDMSEAHGAYRRAVEADSSFALAHSRLAYVYHWLGGDVSTVPVETIRVRELRDHHSRRAMELLDRLPPRQVLKIRARHELTRRTMDALGSLRKAVQEYPDDPELWFLLGETLYFVRGSFAPAEVIERAYDAAFKLDPRHAFYLERAAEFAWQFHADSAMAAERLHMFEQIAPPNYWFVRDGRLALDLAFGDSASQSQAMARVLETPEDAPWTFLLHPRFADLLVEVLMEANKLSGRWGGFLLAIHTFSRGQPSKGLPYLDSTRLQDYSGSKAMECYGLLSDEVRPALPDAIVEACEAALDPGMIEREGPDPWSTDDELLFFYVSAFAIDHDRWSVVTAAEEKLERQVDRAFEAGDSIAGMRLEGRLSALRGYARWRQGQLETALAFLEDPHAARNSDARGWLGQLYEATGRLRDAERVYRSYTIFTPMSTNPLTQRRLGRLYEELEEWDKALESYEYFVTYWDNADPELQPLVEEARQAILRLERLRRD